MAHEQPDISEIRDQLARAIAAAQPHAGGRIRALLDSLSVELARVDERAPTLTYAPPRHQEPVDEPHVIQFRADGFTIQHPLACRPNLFACPVNAVAHDLAEPPALGVFEARLNDASDGLLIGDRVELP